MRKNIKCKTNIFKHLEIQNHQIKILYVTQKFLTVTIFNVPISHQITGIFTNEDFFVCVCEMDDHEVSVFHIQAQY